MVVRVIRALVDDPPAKVDFLGDSETVLGSRERDKGYFGEFFGNRICGTCYVQREIQKITKVSDIVFSAERREQYVRAQEKASQVRGEGVSKEDFGILTSASKHHFQF